MQVGTGFDNFLAQTGDIFVLHEALSEARRGIVVTYSVVSYQIRARILQAIRFERILAAALSPNTGNNKLKSFMIVFRKI